jgi:hypothetical protein
MRLGCAARYWPLGELARYFCCGSNEGWFEALNRSLQATPEVATKIPERPVPRSPTGGMMLPEWVTPTSSSGNSWLAFARRSTVTLRHPRLSSRGARGAERCERQMDGPMMATKISRSLARAIASALTAYRKSARTGRFARCLRGGPAAASDGRVGSRRTRRAHTVSSRRRARVRRRPRWLRGTPSSRAYCLPPRLRTRRKSCVEHATLELEREATERVR